MGEFIPASPDARGRTRKRDIDRIVIHTMEGTMNGTISWFQTPGRAVPTAAHFLIGRDGRTVQMVLEAEKAIHCGSKTEPGWNDRSIGIELEAWTGAKNQPSSIKFPRDSFPDPMLWALADLTRDICRRRKIPMDRAHIVGHGEIPGVTHTDPGAFFPWDALMKLLHPAESGIGVTSGLRATI